MATARKVMLLGEIGVGKTSLARRLVFGTFEADYKATMGVDHYTHSIPMGPEGGEVMLVLWDVDGDFGDSIMGHIYLRGASGAVIVADATRPSTFEGMLHLARLFQQTMPGRPIACAASKMDLTENMPNYALPPDLRAAGIPLTLTSARDGAGVEQLFTGLAARILERRL